MLRTLLLIAPLFALLAAACGGGSDNKAEANGPDGAGAASGPTATATPKLLPTPPKAQDNEVIVSVSAGEMAFTPTLAEFRDLPKTTIDANGKKEGVSLAELATRVSAGSDTYVTLQGYRPDGRVIQFVRQPLAEIGAESVLVVDESGHLGLISSKVPQDSWLINVTMVTFS